MASRTTLPAASTRVEANGRVSLSPVLNGNEAALDFTIITDFIRDPRLDFGIKQELALEETLWAVLNMAHLPFVTRLIPREKFEAERAKHPKYTEFAPQTGTPYGMSR